MSPTVAPPPTDDEVAIVALAGLEPLGPTRLRLLVEHFGSAGAALQAAQRGQVATVLRASVRPSRQEALAAACARFPEQLDVDATRRRMIQRGTRVWIDGDPDFPVPDPLPRMPVALFAEGARVDALGAPRVGIVGTRSATPHGLADARELAATLADHGITVVSGLALGIDGAAHAGAVEAGGLTVGVVATGLDIEYPRRHHSLYGRVREHGFVLGETGFGIGPTTWRFPVRNRIIAALSDLVVVVEATETGGARITAEHALQYDRPVLAVPGSRRNAAAAGTNALLRDGAHPLTDWQDVVLMLGMTPGARRTPPARPAPDERGRAVLAALAGEPAAPEQLIERTGLAPDQIALAVGALEHAGWVTWSKGLVWPR